MNPKKKPTLKKFRKICEACNGVISNIALAFGVSRRSLYNWIEEDQEFRDVIDEFKGKLLDECLKSAKVLAKGVPDIDPKTRRMVGWKERPDGQMLRYFISTLGRREGYGENIDITSNGQTVKPDPIIVQVIHDKVQVLKSNDSEEG